MKRTLGARLKEAREQKRLTQMEVAQRLGISNGTLSGYERDYRDPDTDTLSRLANLYDVSIDWLKGRTKESYKKDAADKLIEYLEAELTDEEIMERMNFKVDSITLTEEEVKEFIAFVRAKRFMKKQ